MQVQQTVSQNSSPRTLASMMSRASAVFCPRLIALKISCVTWPCGPVAGRWDSSQNTGRFTRTAADPDPAVQHIQGTGAWDIMGQAWPGHMAADKVLGQTGAWSSAAACMHTSPAWAACLMCACNASSSSFVKHFSASVSGLFEANTFANQDILGFFQMKTDRPVNIARYNSE